MSSDDFVTWGMEINTLLLALKVSIYLILIIAVYLLSLFDYSEPTKKGFSLLSVLKRYEQLPFCF